MLLQLQVWAFMLLAGRRRRRLGSPVHVEPDGHRWPKRSSSCLFIMSAWSIGVMIDRLMAFNAARKQSRAVCPGSCRRAARRQAGRSDQDCRPLQEEPSGQSCRGRSAGIPGASDEHGNSG